MRCAAHPKRGLLSVVLGGCFVMGHSAAWAGGTSIEAVGMAGMGSANAGQAIVADDPSALFYNPALLTRFKRAEVNQNFVFASIQSPYVSSVNNDGAPTDSGSQGSAGQVFKREGYDGAQLIIPNLFAAIPLSPKTVLGFGAGGSHGLLLHFPPDYPGRSQGRDVDLKVTRLNLGLGHQLLPSLSLGANLSYEIFYESINVKVNYPDAVNKLAPGSLPLLTALNAAGQAPALPNEANGRIRLIGGAPNLQIGGAWDVSERTKFGISYRPKTKFSLRGKLTIQDTPDQQAFRNFLNGPTIGAAGPVLGVNGPQAAADLSPNQYARQKLDFPDEFRMSVMHSFSPSLDVMASFTSQNYSVSKLVYVRDNGRVIEDVPQDFKRARSYRIGLAYKPYKRLTLRTGFAKENGVVGDALRIPILPDNDRTFVAFGAQLEVSRDTTLYTAYQHQNVKEGQVGNNKSVKPVEVSGPAYSGTVKLDGRYLGVGITQRF